MAETFNTIDLFSGCGGLTFGFAWAGFNSVLASDIDENAAATFTANFKETPFLCGDISNYSKEEFDAQIKGQHIDVSPINKTSPLFYTNFTYK